MGSNSVPYEVRRDIFQVLDKAEIRSFGYTSKKIEWLNPNQIQIRLIDIGRGNIDRNKIRNYLDECYEHDEKYVDRRKPSKKEKDSERKAQNEFKLLDTGKELLKFMLDPKMEFINKRFSDKKN